MKNMSIRAKLATSFGIIIALLVCVGIICSISLTKLSDLNENMQKNIFASTSASLNIKYLIFKMSRSMKDFATAASADEMEKFVASVNEDEKIVYKNVALLNERYVTGKAVVDEVKDAFDQWKPIREKVFSLSREGNKAGAMEVTKNQGAGQIEKIIGVINKLTAATEAMAEKAAKQSRETSSTVITLISSVVIVSIVFAVVVALLVTLSIVKPLASVVDFSDKVANGQLDQKLVVDQRNELGALASSLTKMVGSLKDKIFEADEKSKIASEESRRAHEAIAQSERDKELASQKTESLLAVAGRLEEVSTVLANSSGELNTQIEQSSHGSEEQSRRVGETATAMEEMNATVLEVAKNASHASGMADSARTKAQEGETIVGQVVRGIGEVQTQAEELKRDMSALGKQAEGIGQVMNVISDIADQTNLLALNAAIEAARAGEAGRGFAVVADEVRKLAEKTMTATKEVGEAITNIQAGTRKNMDNVDRTAKTIEQATVLASKSGESLKEIVELVDQASDQVRSIAAASEQQSAASEEINRSIEQIASISAQTADSMTRANQSMAVVDEQTQVLHSLIADMQEGGGSPASRPTGKRPAALPR